ncbi:MAG TPA: hypothetical protein DDZ40_10125, partial [Deltaproteobacteria bacterium]|nr:hypothetical protein [Deltaproteobacteria bacterium]
MGWEVSHLYWHRGESGSQHPDRNDQFLFINDKVKLLQEADEPVISV